jgi:MFS family permease
VLGIGALGMAIGSPFAGRLIDRFGARRTMVAGVILCGTGLTIASNATQIWHFYLLFIAIGIGLSTSSMLPASVVIANWFQQKRGMAMGITFMGTSFGGMVMNPVTTYMVQTYGWRKSYLIMGIGMMLLTIPLISLLIRTRPSEMGLLPDGQEPDQEETETISGHTLFEAARTPAFWFIAANMFLTNFMANGIIAHGYPHLTDIGYSARFAGYITAMSRGFMTLGKVTLGLFADRWGARRVFFLSALMTAVGIWILMIAGHPWLAVLYAIVFGFPQGGPLALTPMVAADCHGLANFGAIFGAMNFFSILGAGVGPIVIGMLYESSGSYTSAFTLLIVLTVISAVFIFMARPSKESEFE